MDSLTKNKKTPHELEHIFRQSLCPGAATAEIKELTAGSFNAVYQITLADGTRYVLKIAPNGSTPVLRNEKNILHSEARALRFIRDHTSVPVPGVLHYSGHAGCCDSPFLIMQWMDGEEYQYASRGYSEEEKKTILFQLGAAARELHQLHGTVFGAPGNADCSFPTWNEAFRALFQNILEDGIDADVPLPFDYEYLFRLEEQAGPFLQEVTVPCLIHGDMWLGNVLVHKGRLSALLDFERSLWGDPLMEYPFGLLRNNGDFLRGYRDLVPDAADVSMQVRRTLYNLYHYLIAIIEKPYRGLKGGNANYIVNQKITAEVKALERFFQGNIFMDNGSSPSGPSRTIG